MTIGANTYVVMMGDPNGGHWFKEVGTDSYQPAFGGSDSLQFDAGANVYRRQGQDGTLTEFDYRTGQFLRHYGLGGQKVEVTSRTTDLLWPATVERSYTSGGATVTDQLLYEYNANNSLLTKVTLRRQTGGIWANILKVDYTYYASNESYGALGDLKTVVTSTSIDGVWVATGTSYYRYWLTTGSSSSSTSSGSSSGSTAESPHLLKYVVNPAAYERLKADPAVSNPLTASDALVSLYADYYFEYDTQRRVTKERIQGGSRTYTFSYSESAFSDGFNNWKTKTTETLPDGTQNIIFANYSGQTMLSVFKSGTNQWLDFWKYDSSGRVVMQAHPSAVSGYDETKADLLNLVSGKYQYLRDNDGRIETYAYDNASNFLSAEYIQRGELGTVLKIHEYEYTSCCLPIRSSSSSSSSSSLKSSSSSLKSSSSSSLKSSSSSLKSSSSSSGSACTNPVYFLSKQTDYPSDTDQTKKIITTYAYTFYSGTCQIQQKTITLPVVSAGQNGSGVAATKKEYFDQYGNLTWSMDERGFITRTKFDIVTGAMTQRIDDVDTALVTDEPAGWVTPSGGGLHLITDFESDARGRITQELGPAYEVDLSGVPGGGGSAVSIRRATWKVIEESSTGTVTYTGKGYQKVADSSFKLMNPVSISKTDLGGRVNEQIQAASASTSGTLAQIIAAAGGGSAAFPQSSYLTWATTQYTDCCFAASQRVFHTIPLSGSGSSGTNYDETDYGYSVMKRQNRVVTPGGTITDTVFDVRGNVIGTYIGTNDDGATEDDPTGGGSDPDNNMVLVTANEFDNGQAGGDGNLTKITQYATASDTRVTSVCFDWRDRRVATDGEIDFFEVTYYDNLDRVIKTERYNTIGQWPCSSSSSSSSSSSASTLGNLILRSETKFDDRGRVYQTIRYAVDVTTSIVGNGLTENSWFDAAENPIKQLPAGSSLFTKTTYDSLSRPTIRYSGYDLDETSYAEAGSVSDDTILEQIETIYDNAGNPIQTTVRRRYHNAPAAQTGPLQDPATTPKARVSYMASYPDPLGRIIATADYGTNGGTALSRPATVPGRSDNVLVTTTTYNSKGEPELTTDPAGMVTFTRTDAAGREIERIVGWVSNPSSSSSSSSSSSGGCEPSADQNVMTRKTYTPDGAVATETAVNPKTGDQVTTYTYGTTLADSDIATSNLKRYETYPDSVGGSDRVAFKYNRQGQVKEFQDQNGTVHTFDFDKLGRPIQDRVPTLGTGINSAVRRLATTYEVRGMRAKLTSYDNATVGSGSIVNEVQFAYNDFGQLIADYQSHSGAVNTSTTPKVQYGYASGSANTIRPTSLTYPNGRVLSYDYGTAGGIPDALSRTDAIKDGSTVLAQYSYLGLGTFVITDYTEPDIKWILSDLSGTNDPDTGDIYSGFDRFGRVKDNRWYNYGSVADADRIKYGYDRAGNRIWRQNTVATSLGKAFDEFYLYDGIHRLKDMQRGTLNSLKSEISNLQFAECWSLDTTDNWTNYRQDDTGDGAWDLIQNRANNTVNEITNITESTGPSWSTPAYDAAGNMTTIPKPADPTIGLNGIYDAWNRLTAIKEGGDFVAEYAYDSAKRRTIQKSYSSGVLSETRHLYYTEPSQWQVVEERVGSSSSAERQLAWGLRYIDDLVLIDRDTDGNGSLDERLDAMQDANWNVSAITNGSGSVQERYAYSSYGVPLFLDASFNTRVSSSYFWETLYGGYRWDSRSTLFQIRDRQYHPVMGVWLQRGPLGMTAGLNLYDYVHSMPLGGTDPSGRVSRGESSPSTIMGFAGGGLCQVDLVCWPIFGIGVGPFWHCEYRVMGKLRSGSCRCEASRCEGWAIRWFVCCWCVGCRWSDKQEPLKPGAVTFTTYVPEIDCACIETECRGYPRYQCYTFIGCNSNTGAGCINKKCKLGLTPSPPVVAPGWNKGCPEEENCW